MHFTIAFLAFNLFLMMCSASANFPVVIWHGMGASCCKRGKTEVITKHLEEKLGKCFLLPASSPPGAFGHRCACDYRPHLVCAKE